MRAFAFKGYVGEYDCMCAGITVYDCEEQRDGTGHSKLSEVLGQICGAMVTIVLLVNEEPPAWIDGKQLSRREQAEMAARAEASSKPFADT